MAYLEEAFCLIRNGASIKQFDGASGLPITRIETIADKTVNRAKMGFANIIDDGQYDDYLLQDGDILMSHINSEKHLGKVALYHKENNEKIIHGMNLLVLRPNTKILSLFAYYYFSSQKFNNQIVNITKKSVNQASFTVTALKKLAIELPDINKQKLISRVLSKIDSAIKLHEKQLTDLDLLIKSRFIEMFEGKDYPQKRLSDVCIKITDGTHKTPVYLSEGIVFISAKNVIDGRLNFSDIKYISEEEYQGIQKRCQIEKGDVLLTKSGSLGMTAIVDTDKPLGLFESLAVIKYNRLLLNGIFLCKQMQSHDIQTQLMSNIKGVAVKHLHLNVIASTKVIVPPLDVQERFCLFVQQVDKSKLAVQQSLNELETLKKSLMQQYFG